ncbi:MAG TPA: hypothetical protein VGF87_07140 [Acidimicrobiales bacterium]
MLATFCLLVLGLAAYVGIGLYKIEHAVHHVSIPQSLLAQGQNDLLTIVRGPHHSEEAYLFHTHGNHTNVLNIPVALGVTVDNHTVRLSSLNIHAPVAIITGLRGVGIPVSRYVGVDLHTVDPNSSLGKLATGKVSVTSLIANPTGTTALLEEVASHVYLGPNTSVTALLSLMHVPTTHAVWVPTSPAAHGTVVLASAPYVTVLRHFTS